MATKRKAGKQRRGKPAPQPADFAAEEEALGEELLRVSREERAETVGKQRRGKPTKEQADVAAEEEALGEELLRVSREEQAEFLAGWEKFMKQLSIKRKPIAAKKLREMMIRDGINPDDNQFSRGIIAMREE